VNGSRLSVIGACLETQEPTEAGLKTDH